MTKAAANAATVHRRAAAQVARVSEPVAGEELLRSVRGALTLVGKSVRAICIENGVDVSYGRRVLLGKTNGKRAQALRKEFMKAAGL